MLLGIAVLPLWHRRLFNIVVMHVHKEDTVIVLTGSDRGKTGKILRVIRDRGLVVVAGVNVRTRHRKSRPDGDPGGIEKREMPISVSNVSLLDPKTKKPTRVGYTGVGREKQRLSRKSGSPLPVPGKKKSSKKVSSKKSVSKKSISKKSDVDTKNT